MPGKYTDAVQKKREESSDSSRFAVLLIVVDVIGDDPLFGFTASDNCRLNHERVCFALCRGEESVCFHFFQHDDFLAFRVDELILEEAEVLTRIKFDAEAIFHLPLEIEADETLGEVGFNIGVDIELKLFHTKMLDSLCKCLLF